MKSITKIKNLLKGLNTKLGRLVKGTSLKTGQSNYPMWRTRKKKIWGKKLTKPQRPTGHYQANQDVYNGRIKRRQQNNVWRKKCLKVSNFMKNINLHIQEAQWTPVR